MAISPISLLSPENIYDIYEGLPKKEICRGTQVCKDWYQILGSIGIWKPFFKEAGLPLVEGMGTGFNAVYGNLFFRSLNYEFFKKCYGEVRDISSISIKAYDKFVSENDPFIPSEEPQQKICETSWLVIDPSHVYRPYDETLFNKLNASTDPQDKPEKIEDGKVMKVPFKLRNRKLVIEHTNPDKQIFQFFLPEAMDQCNAAPEKTGFWVMRETVVYYSTAYTEQKILIEEQEGYKVVPLRVRLTFNGMKICETGTCPDKVANSTFANTSDMINARFPMVIGYFAPGAGAYVTNDYGNASISHGAVAGFPAQD